jgi:hypothetical protein
MQENQIALTPRQWMLTKEWFGSSALWPYHPPCTWALAVEFIVTGRSLQVLAPVIGLSLQQLSKLRPDCTDSTPIRLVPQTWLQFLEHLERTTENWKRLDWSSADH